MIGYLPELLLSALSVLRWDCDTATYLKEKDSLILDWSCFPKHGLSHGLSQVSTPLQLTFLYLLYCSTGCL